MSAFRTALRALGCILMMFSFFLPFLYSRIFGAYGWWTSVGAGVIVLFVGIILLISTRHKESTTEQRIGAPF